MKILKNWPKGPPVIEAQTVQFGYPHHSSRLECFTENEPKAEVCFLF